MPYDLGAFYNIVNVHFGGGNWMALSTGFVPQGLQYDFPQTASGTPGFKGITNTTSGGMTVTKADLKSTLKTLGGLSFPGFSKAISYQEGQTAAIFLEQGALSNPFKVKVSKIGGGPEQQIRIVLFKAKSIALGVNLVTTNPDFFGPLGTTPVTFTVDLKALTVS